MSRSSLQYRLLAGIVVIALAVISCNVGGQAVREPTAIVVVPAVTESAPPVADTPVPATETPVPIVHTLLPGEPLGSFESQIYDTDSSALAAQHRTNAGENYNFNLFERPFDQSMNTYFADLDIRNAALNRDATWIYVTITLTGQRQGGGLLGLYAAELDLNVDGRGDWLIAASAPGASWSSDGVRVWQDSNHDVGGGHPIQADAPPQKGDGYETLVDDGGKGADPDAAFARISPQDPSRIQLAFKRALISDDGRFLWGAWAADQGMFHPDWFDFDDHFTHEEAGSPLVELTKYYPLKALYQVDDTCRWGVGFTPTGDEPGACPVPKTPTPVPDNQPPSVQVSHAPTSIFEFNTQVTFTAVASDNVGVRRIRIYVQAPGEGSPTLVQTCDNTTTCTFTGGPYSGGSGSYFAEAEDEAGNLGTSGTKSFWVAAA